MLKSLKIALILMILLFCTSKSTFAATLSETFIKEEISKDINQQLAQITKAEISVNVLRMPYKSITVAEGQISISANINLDYLRTRTLAKVSIYVDGKKEKTFGVPVEITAKDYVWVAKESIKRNSTLTMNNLKLEKKDISSNLKFSINKNFKFTKHLAKKHFSIGEIIDKRFIASIPDVMRNNLVVVTFSTKTLNMTIDAEAMEDGKIGDYIRVKSKKYKRYYKGQIIATNQVLVKI